MPSAARVSVLRSGGAEVHTSALVTLKAAAIGSDGQHSVVPWYPVGLGR